MLDIHAYNREVDLATFRHSVRSALVHQHHVPGDAYGHRLACGCADICCCRRRRRRRRRRALTLAAGFAALRATMLKRLSAAQLFKSELRAPTKTEDSP